MCARGGCAADPRARYSPRRDADAPGCIAAGGFLQGRWGAPPRTADTIFAPADEVPLD